MKRDMTWGGEHTMHYTDDGLWNRTPETCIILIIINQCHPNKCNEEKTKPNFVYKTTLWLFL